MSSANIRIAGVNLPANKHILIALTSLYGIGRPTAQKICDATHIDPQKKVSQLNSQEEELLRKEVQNYEVEGDLRRKISLAIKRIIDLKCLRGFRHLKKLPCRGQRTKTNARTRKGRKRLPKEAKDSKR